MRKKIIGIMLCTVMAFATVGCGLKDGVAESIVEIIEKDNTESGEEVNAEQNDVNKPDPEYRTEPNYDNDEGYSFYMNYDKLVVFGMGYEALGISVEQYMNDYINGLEERAAQYKEQAKDFTSSNTDENTFYHFRIYSSLEVKCCDSKVFSFVIKENIEDNVSHIQGKSERRVYETNYYTGNFNSQTGEEIKYEDLGDISSELVEASIEETEMIEKYDVVDDYKDIINNAITSKECAVPFFIDGRGVTVIFPDNVLTKPNALETDYMIEEDSRAVFANVSFDEIHEFSDVYRPIKDFYSIDLFTPTEIVLADIDGDSEKEKIFMDVQFDEYDWPKSANLFVGTDVMEIEGEAEWYNAKFVHTNSADYIFVYLCWSNDWVNTAIYAYDNGIKYCSEFEGKIVPSADSVVAETRIDALGTWGVEKKYSYNGKEGLTADESGYAVVNAGLMDEDNRMYLDVVKDFYDLNGSLIPAGTRVYPTYYNFTSSTTCIVTLMDYEGNGFDVEIVSDQEQWGYTIDGVREDEIFEFLPYAG